MENDNFRQVNFSTPSLLQAHFTTSATTVGTGATATAAAATQSTALTETSASIEWTNEDALALIEQYRSHSELWNRADPKYKDKLCRFRAWSNISQTFRCTKAEVERKMNVLLTQYRREKHKMLMKLYSGIQPGPSKWYAFKKFDFLERGNAILTAARHHNRHLHRLQQQRLNGLANAGATTSSFYQQSTHRKSRKRPDTKYFGGMGLNLPMFISSSQSLNTFNTEPFPSSSSDQNNQMHIRIPTDFLPTTMKQDSSSSMSNVTGDIARNSENGSVRQEILECCDEKETGQDEDNMDDGVSITTESVPSPNPVASSSEKIVLPSMTKTTSASMTSTQTTVTEKSPATKTTTGTNAVTVRTTSSPSATYSDQIIHDELDIKQELGDFFHVPLPPAPPDSNRSYSSSDENRPAGVVDSFDDFVAQDLRVSAAAVAAAKGIDFQQFVLSQHGQNIDSSSSSLHHQRHLASATHQQMLIDSFLSERMRSECSAEQLRNNNNNNNNANNIKPFFSTKSTASPPHLTTTAQQTTNADTEPKDDCNYIGSNVTLKLRSMDRTQRIIAEKLISEIIFYGQFSELEKTAKIIPK